MMREVKTLDKHITLSVNSVELPTSGVIEKIGLLFSVDVKNAGSSAWSGTIEDIAKLFEIQVVANGTDYKYSLLLSDVLIMNYYDSAGKAHSIDDTVNIANGATETIQIYAELNAGEIHALLKEKLELYVKATDTTVAADVTIENLDTKVTVTQRIYGKSEYVAEYVENGHVYIIEPKVYAYGTSFDQYSELTEIFSVPTGAIARRAFLVFKDNNGRSNSIVDKFAFIKTKPRFEIPYQVDFATSQAMDKIQYALDAPLAGVSVLDYDRELIVGGLDLRDVQKDTYRIGVKTAAAGNMRYVSHEYVPMVY